MLTNGRSIRIRATRRSNAGGMSTDDALQFAALMLAVPGTILAIAGIVICLWRSCKTAGKSQKTRSKRFPCEMK
jgi:hypothetical protein